MDHCFTRNFELRRKLDEIGPFTNYHTMPHFDALKIYSCGKHCEKRRDCFYTLYDSYFPF